MTLKRIEVLETLLGRVAGSADPVHFRADETNHWEPGAQAELLEAGLLKRASDTDWLECRRCTRRCPRPVEQLVARSSAVSPRLVTTCDLRDDVTIVPVHPMRLKRWKSNRALIAEFVGRQLGIRLRRSDYDAGRVSYHSGRLGNLRFSGSLEFSKRQADFRIGDERRNLDELFAWQEGPPCLDMNGFTIWASTLDAYSRSSSYKPSRRRQQRRKAETAARNKAWQEQAEVLKAENPERKKSDLAVEIFATQAWPGVNSGATIERLIRLPRKTRRKKFP